jgi:hypothetical protein
MKCLQAQLMRGRQRAVLEHLSPLAAWKTADRVTLFQHMSTLLHYLCFGGAPIVIMHCGL